MEASQLRFGFLGAGRMATALSHGWLAAGLVTTDRVSASDPLPQARLQFGQETGTSAIEDNRAIVQRSDVIVLAVKPQSMAALLAEIRPLMVPRHLVVSIAAGVTLGQLAEALGTDGRLIRVMPNTPCLVGASASGFRGAASATRGGRATGGSPAQRVGRAFRVAGTAARRGDRPERQRAGVRLS